MALSLSGQEKAVGNPRTVWAQCTREASSRRGTARTRHRHCSTGDRLTCIAGGTVATSCRMPHTKLDCFERERAGYQVMPGERPRAEEPHHDIPKAARVTSSLFGSRCRSSLLMHVADSVWWCVRRVRLSIALTRMPRDSSQMTTAVVVPKTQQSSSPVPEKAQRGR